ncbi:MAG TPA: methylmalonyl-CoA mutase family protein, partial [Ktedonobacterales bacterium]|nr:methylmalonyl-CoA mutase family protein [Ktedonobacterales bacterium]
MLEQKPRESEDSAAPDGRAAPPDNATGATPLFNQQAVARIAKEEQHWEATEVARAVKRLPERHQEATTQSGMPVKRLYTPADTASLDYERDLGFPGLYPYTRGVQPTMYRAKPWTMRMFAGFGTAEETNER